MLEILPATSPEQIEEVRRLFLEYEKSIGVSLCFQNFEEEVLQLPGAYAEPEGTLLIAQQNESIAGCCALRRTNKSPYPNASELKRLYVRPVFRGKGIAKLLAGEVLQRAAMKGYETVVLDTLESMTEAQALYATFGFQEIPPYYSNPVGGTKYMKLDLRQAGLPQQ